MEVSITKIVIRNIHCKPSKITIWVKTKKEKNIYYQATIPAQTSVIMERENKLPLIILEKPGERIIVSSRSKARIKVIVSNETHEDFVYEDIRKKEKK